MTSPFELSFRCDVPWESMDELAPGKRHCGECKREVIDVSALTRKAATRLMQSEENLCVNYLAGPDGAPIFRRPPTGTGLAAIASVLLAACSQEEPSCELSPEPATLVTLEPDEHLLSEGDGLAGPLEGPGAPMPPVDVNTVSNQPVDTAEPGDANDVDGVSPRHRPPRTRPRPPIYTRTGGVAVRHVPAPTPARDRNH